MSSPTVHLAVLVVASDPAKADLATAMVIRGRATSAGHQIVAQNVTKVMEAGIRSQLARWIDDADIDVILITGAVEKEEVAAAIKPLVTQRLEGFTDLFRYLAFQEMGAGAMLSNAEAAQCSSTYVFVLPGSVGAVGTAMDKLILPQLDPDTEPKNLVSSMPGPKKRADAVPSAIPPERTQGGSGVAPKMPARGKAHTGKNIVRRAQDDPPTKQIDVARLEQQIALSADRGNDAQTKPNIDLRKMLPRVPPGADETLDTDTDVELLAAPPPERGLEKRLETSPVIPPPRPAPGALPSIKGNAFSAKEGTSPGAAPPPAGTGVKPLPSLKGIDGDAFDAKEGTSPGAVPPGRSRPLTGPRPRPISVPPTNAFGTKEGTSPGTVPPARTGPQAVAAPSTRTRAPSGSVPAGRTREPSGPYATPIGGRARTPSAPEPADPTTRTQAAPEAGRTRAPSAPPPVPAAARTREPSQPAPSSAPPAREWQRQYVATPAVPMPVTRLPSTPGAPSKPISSGMLTPPSSSIFAAAARGADEAGAANGAQAAASATPSGEMAPLIDAAELEPAEAEAEIEEEAAPPPRTREPTPPPVTPPTRAATTPPVTPPTRAATAPPAVAKAKPTSFDDVVSTPTRTSGELPVGTFSYPTKRSSSGRAGKILALLVAAGVGFAAVVYLLPRLTGHGESSTPMQTAQNEQPPAAPPTPAPPPAPATPDPGPPAPATPDPAPTAQEPAPAPAPTPTATPPTPTTATALPAKPTTPKPATPKPPIVTKPDTATARPVEKPAETKPAETKPAETKPAEAKPAETKPAETKPASDPGCDEVACVLAKYNRPCCERYRPATTDLKPRAGNIPEELDRAMVRTGVEKIKPAVVACGEKVGGKGTVKLSVSVAPDGNVKSAEVAESPDEALGSCVAAAMRKAQFGKSVNGGSFTYPFVF